MKAPSNRFGLPTSNVNRDTRLEPYGKIADGKLGRIVEAEGNMES